MMDIPQSSVRYQALDVFRGLTIFLMILVNNQGAGAKPFPVLVHADWFGFTAADAVFPSFLFIVGAAMSFALSRPMPDHIYYLKTLRRTALIFLLGYLMYVFPFVHRDGSGWALNPIENTRIMGVLQRIGLCYGLTAIAVRLLKTPLKLVVLMVGILVGYWGFLVLGAPGHAFDKAGNFGSKLDLIVLGKSHLWPWDDGFEPEGLLGTLPAAVNCLAGYVCGLFIRKAPVSGSRLWRMAGVGLGLIIVALVINPVFPISKKLWTSSFVCLTVGIDLMVLSGLMGLIDLAGWRRGAWIFEVVGKNPIAVYLFSELVPPLLWLIMVTPSRNIWDWVGIDVFQALTPGPVGCLLTGLAYLAFCWGFGWLLDRNRIYLKV